MIRARRDHGSRSLKRAPYLTILRELIEWILDDAPLMNPRGNSYTSPRELLQVYIDEFDKAYEERTMFLLTTHPHIIGHRSRIVILEQLIAHIRTRGDVWFATHEQAARYVMAQAGM